MGVAGGGGPVASRLQQGPPDASAGVVGMHRELFEMGAGGAAILGGKRVNTAQPDRRVPGHQHDERGSELLDRARTGQRPDAEVLERGVGRRLEGREEAQLIGSHRADERAGPSGVHPPTVASRPVRAVVCNELGPPSVLKVEERSEPEPGPGEVAVAVEAAGVNFVDGLFVAGQYQIKPKLPFVPGSEVAGHVVKVGPDVTRVAIGDRVLASVGLGGFASRVVVPADSAIALPDGLDAPRAATFTQSYSTSLFALRDRAHAAPGETVLVLGAGGGVGLAAIGVARALGCRVLGVASSVDKREAALGAGAESVLDPVAEPLKESVRAWAGGSGVDLVVDPVGGPLAEPSLRALGDRGRYLVIGFASGDIPAVPLNQVLLRNRSVIGIDWGIWAMTHPAEQRALLLDLLAMVASGTLDPVRPAEYPLDDVAEALEDLLGRRAVGKIALVP
jgi:NADPH:quinone reductase